MALERIKSFIPDHTPDRFKDDENHLVSTAKGVLWVGAVSVIGAGLSGLYTYDQHDELHSSLAVEAGIHIEGAKTVPGQWTSTDPKQRLQTVEIDLEGDKHCQATYKTTGTNTFMDRFSHSRAVIVFDDETTCQERKPQIVEKIVYRNKPAKK